MRIVICKLIFHFDFELCTDVKGWLKEHRAWASWTVPDLMIKPIPRNATATEEVPTTC